VYDGENKPHNFDCHFCLRGNDRFSLFIFQNTSNVCSCVQRYGSNIQSVFSAGEGWLIEEEATAITAAFDKIE